MEQQAKDDITASKTSPSKRSKQHHSTTDAPGLDDKNQRVVTTSNSSKSSDVNIFTLEISLNQQSTGTGIMNNKFVLHLEEDCNLAPEENFEPPLAGLKSLGTK